MRRRVLEVVAFLALVGILFPIQSAIDARKPPQASALLYTPDRRFMRVVACGHGKTVADFVWVQSMNYIMDQFKSGKTHIEHLYALFDTLTDLDPDFVDAYVLGGVFLSAVAQEPERSIELLEKGQGHLIDDGEGKTVRADAERPGTVHPDNANRWKMLSELAATHLVSYAGFAPTLEERTSEIHAAGRFYSFGAARYPVASFPARPEWWEQVGASLQKRQVDKRLNAAWRDSVRQVWRERGVGEQADSPLGKLVARRLAEIDARAYLEWLETALEEKWRGPGEPTLAGLAALVPREKKMLLGEKGEPVDPLGFGFFVTGGKVVAPAIEAEAAERSLARAIGEHRIARGRFPASLDEVRLSRSWTWVEPPTYDPKTGEVHVAPRKP